jgi:hypothetical protein
LHPANADADVWRIKNTLSTFNNVKKGGIIERHWADLMRKVC